MIKKNNNSEWLELCHWVEKELFNYDNTQKLKKDACLSLMGLRNGKAVANNHTKDYGNYPYKVILMAFKVNKNTILNAIKGKDFHGSESTKMRYICAIMRDKIDDVYIRYKNAQKSEEKIETINTDTFEYIGAKYHNSKECDKHKQEKFEGLW